MTPERSDNERLRELLIELVDGQPDQAQFDELQQLVKSVPDGVEQVVDHLLLDSLLCDDLGREPLTALVDLVVDSDVTSHSDSRPSHTVTFSKTVAPIVPTSWFLRATSWLAAAACVALVIFLLTGHGEKPVYASASQIVEAAIHTHAEPIERVYVVEVERHPSADSGLNLPRDVRISTQGDKFWVEMNGVRRWAWGRDVDGAIWMTLGPRRAVEVGANEMGVPLKYIGDLYTLHLETLLQNFLKHCRLERTEGPAGTDVITAVPRRRWSERPLRRATIEVDGETKAIRRLVIEREFPDQSSTVVTFTLVDSRLADEAMYRPEGHLIEPYRLFARETEATKRREMMINWFGPMAEHWIVAVPQPDAVQSLSSESEQQLRDRVSRLFESLRTGQIDECVKLTDPAIVRDKGRVQVFAYFRAVSNLVRASKVQSTDRVIKAISLIESGQAARVDIEVTLNGVKQPPGFEIWNLADGQWFYRETPK